MGTVVRPIIIEEFILLPGNEHMELVRGEVVKTMPPGGKHSIVAGEIMRLLGNWAKQGAGGYAGVEGGFILSANPDTLRGPDVFYVQSSKIPPSGVPDNFWTITPDLAVEVVSPNETDEKVRDKVHDFLTAGTPLVWVVYPRRREVVIHTPDGLSRTYAGEDVLESPEVLPGFSCKVSEIFE